MIQYNKLMILLHIGGFIMSVGVCIINKNGIALAADSAGTVGEIGRASCRERV